MASDRRLRILTELIGTRPPEPDTRRLCDVGVGLTGTTGAGIMLFAEGVSRGSLCATDPVSARIEDLQFTLGQGPCIDACAQGRPALEPDLARSTAWAAFGPPAVEAGARAVFGFPVRIGAAHLGALDLYRDRPGPLNDSEHADALVLADLAAEMILLVQSHAPPGQLAAELEAGADFRYVVHQASGMVAVQLGASVSQALIRLRVHAFAADRPLTDVARDVVARTLRFRPNTDEGIA